MGLIYTVAFPIEEFEAFAALRENADKRLEWMNGHVIAYEKTSNSRASESALLILAAIVNFVYERDLGRCTGADGGYVVAGARFNPDGAFISWERQPEGFDGIYNPLAPDIAVEVVSPSDLEKPKERIDAKILKYLQAEIGLLWMVFPERKEVDVYAKGQFIRTATLDDTLDGGDVLPGFALLVKKIFPKAKKAAS
jgi:Uma2 family endonuclease